jgi:hypothetical protein
MATRKAKRKLSDISFEKEGAHVALTSKEQGGPANSHDYALVLKSNNFSEEFIEKMQQVRVTMELPDFLSKFFNMWSEDAKVLATMMGYVEPADTQAMETEEAQAEVQDWIKARMEAFEILKAANEAESLAEVLSTLDETEYLAMLNDQALIEKAFNTVTESTTAQVADTSPACEVINEEVSTSVVKQELEKSNMDEDLKVETVEKAQFELVQKALEEQKVQLEKAMETIAQFEAEKKAAVEKARKSELVAVIEDEAKAETLFKAVKDASDEDFQAVVKTLADIQKSVQESALFNEQGASTQEEPVIQESAVAKVLKAKLTK